MIKWLTCLILTLLVLGSFFFYRNSLNEQSRINQQIAQLEKIPDRDDALEQQISKLKDDVEGKATERTFKGILLTILSAGLVGVLFVTMVLPGLAHRFAHAVYDSGEMLEKDPMHDGLSLVAQGEYILAVEAFKTAARSDPLNRLPWVEIARIQRNHLMDPEAAIQTLRSALEGQEWQVNDAAFFLFRLAELYDEDRHDRATATAIMHQVIDEFPDTRHSANSRHKLREWGLY